MKEFLKHLNHDTTIGHLLLSPAKKLYDICGARLFSEKFYIKQTFKNSIGYDLNLENPKTLNEKIQWLQLNDRTPLRTLCADKYAVRDYVKEKIGEEYLVPLIFHTTNPTDIVPGNLPDFPFIIKTNHGCGDYIIVKDKSTIDWKRVQKNLKKSLKSNYYYKAKEWQYKNIKPYIVVEKLLLDKNFNIPNDYKFNCFNGKLGFPEVHIDRYIDYRKNCYDSEWNILNCEWGAKRGSEVKKPKLLTKMILLAEILAKDFRYVRVDLYNLRDKIYFGELTFSPGAGLCRFNPPEWDRKFGNELKL